MFVPRPRFAYAELRDERIHFRVELNEHLVGVMVISRHIVPGCVSSRPPKKLYACSAQCIGGDGVVPVILEFERDVMDPRLRYVQDVDDMMLAVAKLPDPLIWLTWVAAATTRLSR